MQVLQKKIEKFKKIRKIEKRDEKKGPDMPKGGPRGAKRGTVDIDFGSVGLIFGAWASLRGYKILEP